jgi:hypothetical protein
LSAFRVIDDRHAEGMTLAAWGNGYLKQGRFIETMSQWQRALEIFRQTGDRHMVDQVITAVKVLKARLGLR